MAKMQNVTEELKAYDPKCWVQAMNNIKENAEESVLREVVYQWDLSLRIMTCQYMTTNRQQELRPETKQLMEYMVRYHQDLLKKIFKEHKKPLTM